MKRRFLIGLPILAAILAMSVGVALSKKEDASKGPANLSGQWVLDAAKSDTGPGMRGAGMRGRGGWRGREGRPDGAGPQGGEGRERRGRMRLPGRIRIEQTAASLTIADSADVPIETIGIGSATWSKGRLEVVRDGPRGKLTQTFALEEGGRSLVIRTKMESSDSRPSREFKRVYRRSST